MTPISLQDLAPSKQQFLSDVLAGLRDEPRNLPCKYLYDARGSALFERISLLDEYYLTRAEMEILRKRGDEMADCLGPRCAVVEYGSGSSLKTRELLTRLEQPVALIPVDISRDHLSQTSRMLSRQFPELAVSPVCADFTQSFALPSVVNSAERTIVYFPGSTIGNFDPEDAAALLEGMAEHTGTNGGILIGVDLQKSKSVLEAAYNDVDGVTADFNLNLLRHINRELGADFRLGQFQHRAHYNEKLGRVEMHLVARCDQTVTIDGVAHDFSAGESIHTENSYKYTLDQSAGLAATAGFDVAQVWLDSRKAFSVQYLTPRGVE